MDQIMIPQQDNEIHTPEQKKDPPRKSRNGLSWAALACSVAALAISVAALRTVWPGGETQPAQASEPEMAAYSPAQYITYRGHQLPVDEEIANSAWERAAFAQNEAGWITYEKDNVSAVAGIDVSSHQGEIDWQQVADSGMEFAMIRAGYRGYGDQGRLMEDEQFRANMQGALDAGLDVGVYFFSQATNVWEAEEEAQMLLQALDGYNVTYPVVFDWEYIQHSNARTDDVPGKTITLMAETFCDLVAQAGYIPGVYFNQNLAYLDLELGRLKDYVFWLAEYGQKPDFYYHFDMWQYSSTGQVPGVDTNVDLNLSFRDFAEEAGPPIH